jgi:hypothetical protein
MEEKQIFQHRLHQIMVETKEQYELAKGRHILEEVSGRTWIWNGLTLHGGCGILNQFHV